MPKLESSDVQVLVCSVDSHFVHKSWEEHELLKLMPDGVPYPMLADPGGRIGQMYSVFDEGANMHIRGRFIIDPDGNVAALEILPEPVGRNIPEMVRQIKALQRHRESGGTEVCPAGWREGKETFKPGVKLVGHIADTWKPE